MFSDSIPDSALKICAHETGKSASLAMPSTTNIIHPPAYLPQNCVYSSHKERNMNCSGAEEEAQPSAGSVARARHTLARLMGGCGEKKSNVGTRVSADRARYVPTRESTRGRRAVRQVEGAGCGRARERGGRPSA